MKHVAGRIYRSGFVALVVLTAGYSGIRANKLRTYPAKSAQACATLNTNFNSSCQSKPIIPGFKRKSVTTTGLVHKPASGWRVYADVQLSE